jgi:hypothetical protein
VRRFLGARNRLAQALHFRGLQAAIAPLLKVSKIERAKFHAPHFLDRMIERK